MEISCKKVAIIPQQRNIFNQTSPSFHFSFSSLRICELRTLRICERLIFLSEKLAVCPLRTSLTGIRFRWMDFTAMGKKWPRGSGPKSDLVDPGPVKKLK